MGFHPNDGVSVRPDVTMAVMRRRGSLLLILVALVVSLSACGSSSELDWEAAQSQANAFTEAASASARFLGAGSLHSIPNAHLPLDEPMATLSYPSEVRISEISVACFGDGEAIVGVTVRTASSWTGMDPITLTCDSEVHAVPLSAPLEHINAISLNGIVEKGAGAVIAAVITGVAESI